MSTGSVRSDSLVTTTRPDMNMATESKRILCVLDKAISRMKFVGVLKSLVGDDGYLLSDVINSDDHFFIVQICRKYEFTGVKFSNKRNSVVDFMETPSDKKTRETTTESRSGTPSGASQDSDEDSESFDSSNSESASKKKLKIIKTPTKVDSELSKVILVLEEYPEVHQLAAQIQQEISPQMRFFIKCLAELRKEVALHLGESAAQEKKREAYLRECYIKNEKAKMEIDKLENELLEHRTETNYCIIGRNVLINRHQNKIIKIQKTSSEAIDKKVKESEKAMTNDWKGSIAVQETLKLESESIKLKLENLLQEDLAVEKNLRMKRTKVESQLLGWLQKFDLDIDEKQAEEEEIQRLLEVQDKELEEIRLKLEEQEEEYDELMQEKAEYELKILEQRLYAFIVNRSARRIQRYFRIYKAKKLAKKKAKKDRKGKKGGKKKSS